MMNNLSKFSTLLLIIFFSVINLEAKNIKDSLSKTTNSNTIVLDKESFAEKICDYKSNAKEWKYIGDKPAIIDFYAEWCGPCKILSPRLEDIAAEYQDSIYVYKVNIDEQRELATMFNIKSIPTLLFIPMDATPQITQGLLPKEALKNVVTEVLLKKNTPEIELSEVESVENDNTTEGNIEELNNIDNTIPTSSVDSITSKGKFKRSKANIEKFKKQ